MKFVQRLYFHTKRYKGEILYSSSILAIIMIMVVYAFPSDTRAIASYIGLLEDAGLDILFSSYDLDAPGWLFWVSLMGSAYTYFVSAIASIKIGSKIFPTKDEVALELIASSPKASRVYLIESVISGIIAIFLIFLPSFTILSIYSVTQNAMDSIPRLAIMFLFNMGVSVFFIALTSLMSSFRFSQGAGTKIGYFYIIYAFLIELTAGSVDEYKDYAKISVNTYISPSAGILNGEHNWNEFLTVIAISFFFLSISYYLIKKPDYIEKISVEKSGRLEFLPKFSPDGKLARKYPILFDQFRMDRSFFFIWFTILNFLILYVIVFYTSVLADDPEQLTRLMGSFDTGMMKAFTFGYDVEASYMGFLVLEFFGLTWVYYGLFIFIPAVNIASRDQYRDEQDLIWSNSVTPEQVIINRTIALQIFFTILFWASYLFMTILSVSLDTDYNNTSGAFIVGYIYYTGLTFMLVGLTMLFPVSKGRQFGRWFYIASVMIIIIAFMEPSVEFIRYISIVNYYDPVGMIMNKVQIIDQLIIAIIVLIPSVLLYFASLKFRYRNVDLIS